MTDYCVGYCGAACVNGSCPNATAPDEWHPRRVRCDECWLYEGCKDCCFEGTELCIRLFYQKDKGELKGDG